MITDKIKSEIQDKFSKNCPYIVTDYGKMIRSRLGSLILKSLNTDITDSAITIMTTTELIHTASLFHDDVIDNEKIRRTPNTDNKTAVLYGDIILTNAINLLLEINDHEIIKIFNNAIKNMCEGEILQKSQTGTIPALEDYLRKTELKTSSIFAAEMKALAICTNIPSTVSEKLTEFCNLFGIAFQIKNDLEDVLNEQNDLKQGVYTAPFVLTNSTALTDDAIEKTKRLLDNYIERAIDCLNILQDSSYKKELIGEAECLKK